MSRKQLAFLASSFALLMVLLAAGLFGQGIPKDNIYRYLSIFTEVFALVRSNYVDAVPPNQLVEGAFAGVSDGIDEYSFYVAPGEMAEYTKYVEDDTNGVGLVVTKRFGYGYVIAAIDGSPADKAGLEAGDFLESVNGVSAQKLSVWQIRNALVNSEAKPARLRILRSGLVQRDEVVVRRGTYKTPGPAVLLETIGSVGHVKIPFFSEGTVLKLRETIATARAQGLDKIIVDVRGNGGGSYPEAISSADEFLRSGTITSKLGRRVPKQVWEADKNSIFDGHLIVLADQSTAGSAEVFVAAIKGNSRGKLVGLSSYGMSIIQKFVTLPSGGGLNLTIGHYTTPDLKPIKEQGVRPDVIVDMAALPEPDDGKKKKDEELAPEEDLILKKALSLLGETAALKAAA